MSTFELKTHQIGRTYSNPHFFILNKRLNSGKPLSNPCHNCFVVISKTEEEKHSLYHLSMILQIGGFYAYYLKESVIPFISINDCKKTLTNAYITMQNDDVQLQKYINIVSVICKKEAELQKVISKMADLKVSYIQSLFSKRNIGQQKPNQSISIVFAIYYLCWLKTVPSPYQLQRKVCFI
ncbi:MAG: hypothetical protein R3342_01725 [Lutibacter sp.]|uniref:DUF6943 family protein n=1 Tax=Lutibacter sp. TaxID=1925666 RepID=UPI00299D492E|nr:hypothetical protein [Lutibacter sp.]MDX1828241.1 hypothetical protein [Lutibacter sp.]